MTHIVTSHEVQQTQSVLGFLLINKTNISPEQFINQEFHDIELFNFLESIDILFQPMLAKENEKKLTLDTPPPSLNICFSSSDNIHEDSELLFERTFIREKNVLKAKHDYLVIPKAYRNQGLSRVVMALCLRQYELMGVTKVQVHAGFENGGYAWARMGFRATDQRQVKKILDDARVNPKIGKEQYEAMKALYDAYYLDPNRDFRGFFIYEWSILICGREALMGSDWIGEFDLSDPSELVNFKNYVKR